MNGFLLFLMFRGMMKILYTENFVKKVLEKYIKVNHINYLNSGNHCDAFVFNKTYVIKLPKNKKANDSLKKEVYVLTNLKGKLNLDIPTIEFTGNFKFNNENFIFTVSKLLAGKTLVKKDFINLPQQIEDKNANAISLFLFLLHKQKEIFQAKRKDLCLIHGDFSLNHCLFDSTNHICAILDFADVRIGKFKSDFNYLLDDDDEEEFGKNFGLKVLKQYLILKNGALWK